MRSTEALQRFEGGAGLGEALRYVRLLVRDNHGSPRSVMLSRVVFLVRHSQCPLQKRKGRGARCRRPSIPRDWCYCCL